MIKTVDGDVLCAKETYIVHQVNCSGVMGRGLALSIRNKYPDVYRRYQQYCDEHRAKYLLGRVLLIPADDGKVICNVFGQNGYGTSSQQTDYAALSKALTSLEKIVPEREAIAMPYQIGCGLGGGNWMYVERMIRDIFKRHDVVLYQYK